MSFVLAAVFALGCGEVRERDRTSDAEPLPPLTAEPTFQSGSRLRANVRDGGDGATLWANWHDLELDADCDFGTAADGSIRCVPITDARAYYLDFDCTMPVAARSPTATSVLPKYASWHVSNDVCYANRASAVSKLGAAHDPEGNLYWRPDDGACKAFNGPTSSEDMQLFEIGEEVPPSAMVAGNVVSEPLSEDGFAISKVVADDGAWVVKGVVETASGKFCKVVEAAERVWVPGSVLRTFQQYGDAKCRTLVSTDSSSPGSPLGALGSLDRCPQTSDFMTSTHGACPFKDLEIHRLGAPTQAAYARGAGSTCVPNMQPVDGIGLGEEVGTSTFPRLEEIYVGAGALRAVYRKADGRVVDGVGFVDAATGDSCSAELLCDDTTRCVPPSLPQSIMYSDSACTKPIYDFYADPCGAENVRHRISISDLDIGGLCIRAELYEVGGLIQPKSVYRKSGGVCARDSVDKGGKYYDIRALAPSDFLTVETRTE